MTGKERSAYTIPYDIVSMGVAMDNHRLGPKYAYPRLSRYSRKVAVFAQLIRPFTVFSAFMVGLFLGFMSNVGFLDALLFGLMMASAQAVGQAVNQIADVEIDKINKPWRPLPSGRLSEDEAWKYAYFLHMVGFLTSMLMYLLTATATPVVVYAAAELLAVFYSLEPVRAKARGAWTSLLWQAVARGLYPPIAASLVFFNDIGHYLGLSILAFLWVLALQPTKDFSDIEGDAAFGIETLPVRYGVSKAVKIMKAILGIYATALLSMVALGYMSPLMLSLLIVGYMAFRFLTVESVTENTVAWNMYYIGLAMHYLLYYVSIQLTV